MDLTNFYKFIDFMRKTINKINEKITIRESKLDFNKMLYSICIKNGLHLSYEQVKSHLKIRNIADVKRQSICERRPDIESSLIKELNDELYNYLKEIYGGNRSAAFDGSPINLPIKAKYFKKKESEKYRSATIGSLYDTNLNVVINYSLDKSFDERNILIKQLHYLSDKDIVIGDRGFSSNEVIWELINKNINFILRIPNNYNVVKEFIKSGKDDDIVNYELTKMVSIKVRMVKYVIHKEVYYLLTSLTDYKKYSIESLKEMYKTRWNIETDFRYSKSILSLGYLMSENKNSLEQDVYVHQFIGLIECAIRLTCFNNENGKYKMNTNNCYTIILEKLLKLLLCKQKITKKIKYKIKRCIQTSIESKILINKDRHYSRKPGRPIQHMSREYREDKTRKKKIKKNLVNIKNRRIIKKTSKKCNKLRYIKRKTVENKINKYVINGCQTIYVIIFANNDND